MPPFYHSPRAHVNAAAFATVITVILLFFSPILFGFFTKTPALIDLATRMISWVLGMMLSIVMFAIGKWKKKMYDSMPD